MLGISFLTAEPWGKDADLVAPSSTTMCQGVSSPSWLTCWGTKAIRFHQEVISPADGPRSNYIPSSSQYTLDAMRKYGFFRGYVLGCDRLMRENDEKWVYRRIRDTNGVDMKWDPIP